MVIKEKSLLTWHSVGVFDQRLHLVAESQGNLNCAHRGCRMCVSVACSPAQAMYKSNRRTIGTVIYNFMKSKNILGPQ